MKKERNILEIFKDSGLTYQAAPRPDSWKKIERRLNTHRSRNKIIPFTYLSAAASISIVVMLSAGIWMYVKSDKQSGQSASLNTPLSHNNSQIYLPEWSRKTGSYIHDDKISVTVFQGENDIWLKSDDNLLNHELYQLTGEKTGQSWKFSGQQSHKALNIMWVNDHTFALYLDDQSYIFNKKQQ